MGQLVHDRDTKFTEGFDRAFQAAGVAIVKTPFQSPMANAFAELELPGLCDAYHTRLRAVSQSPRRVSRSR